MTVDNFYVNDPQLWSLNIMNGTNMRFSNIYCNATAVDAPYGSNWVQNTDGFGEYLMIGPCSMINLTRTLPNTMDVENVQLTNFVYQGGDDCVAIKPRSYNVDIRKRNLPRRQWYRHRQSWPIPRRQQRGRHPLRQRQNHLVQ